MNGASELRGIVHVVDDDAAFRAGIGRVLTAARHVARLYASAAEYLASHDAQGPACLLLDLYMPGPTGLELQTMLAGRDDAHPVIFLSGHGDVPTTVRAMQNGAIDFLTKPVPTATLLAAVARALECDLERQARVLRAAELRARYATLTPREREVMAGVVAGRLNKQICHALDAAERTIKTHRARVMEKMQVRSVADLVRLAGELDAAGVAMRAAPPP